jgi:hypothetical protein
VRTETKHPALRVLCYSPYDRWTLHGLWEMTILHALRLRGAEVRYVLCDGQYSDCDLFWAATVPRSEFSCLECQAHVAGLASGMRMPFEWLGRSLAPEERREARCWADRLPDDKLLNASYGDWEVGRWVESSVHSHLRISHFDFSDPLIVDTYRSYLYSGLVACFAIQRLLDEQQPDVVFLLSGRLSSTRIALELAQKRGIRVVCHERGLVPESLRMFQNARCTSLSGLRKAWQEWESIPLDDAELEQITRHLEARERGQQLGWKPFSPPRAATEPVREQLGLQPNRPLWVLFTSSDDEGVAEEDFQSCFPDQMAWIRATVEFARLHAEIDLVVRVHPNTAGKRASGDNVTQLAELRELACRLPGNTKMIMPEDPISTYSLMELAHLGLTYRSMVGLEMSCKGKPTIVAAGSAVSGLPFVQTVRNPSEYAALLEQNLTSSFSADAEAVQRQALRFAYLLFFRWNILFPLVRMPDPHNGELAYDSLEALLPGQDPSLDRICRIILEGQSVCSPPSEADYQRCGEAKTTEARSVSGSSTRG